MTPVLDSAPASPHEPQRPSGDSYIDVAIVGAGFSGLGMAIQLIRHMPHLSFLIFEKSGGIGGTWRENTYPGCACDIPSHLYSFSFEPNAQWSRMFGSQPEIQDYLEKCAAKYGVLSRIRLHCAIASAAWNESTRRWELTTAAGDKLFARVFVSAVGALNLPNIPSIPGLAQFSGPVFHSSQWDHSVPLEGRNVAVIGTGASAIQFVPRIAPVVTKLMLFQRTPAWVAPRGDFTFSPKLQDRFRRWPALARWFRHLLFLVFEARVALFLNGVARRGMTRLVRKHLTAQIEDPRLRAALTPAYAMGCKRILVSDDFYPALARENVELVTSAIERIDGQTIVTADGTTRRADVLILGTGFRPMERMAAIDIVGRSGIRLIEAWREGPNALLGIAVSGFPNLFLLLGPNTGLGHNSALLMIEAQIGYVIRALKLLERRKCDAMVLRRARELRFTAHLERRLKRTVWQSGGCRSWYQDERTGKNFAIWPGSVIEYLARTRRVSAADYELSR